MSEIFHKEQLSQKRAKSFLSKIDIKSPKECWNWEANKTFFGYGKFANNGKNVLAHRIAYVLANGPIADGKIVLHSCDNPSCCNPNHLSLGSHAENSRQREERGRGNKPRGENHFLKKNPSLILRGTRHGGSKLRDFEVLQIRKLHKEGLRCAQIAKLFTTVRYKTIHKIIKGGGWSHLS